MRIMRTTISMQGEKGGDRVDLFGHTVKAQKARHPKSAKLLQAGSNCARGSNRTLFSAIVCTPAGERGWPFKAAPASIIISNTPLPRHGSAATRSTSVDQALASTLVDHVRANHRTIFQGRFLSGTFASRPPRKIPHFGSK